MKKLLVFLLALTLALPSVGILSFASSNTVDLKFAVASDLHYDPPVPLEHFSDDEVFYYANRRAAMENESGFIIDEFLRQCAESDVQYVLISGDLADNGRSQPEDHIAVAEKLRKFEEETGKDVFVIDGNHDLGADAATDTKKFKEIYADFGWDLALEQVETDCSYTADLGEKYRLIALDSCDPTVSTEDGMNLQKVNWVLAQAKKAKADGRYPILMMHHNLLDHMPLQRIFSRNFIVRFHYTTAELFADAGIKLVLTGHEHCSDAATYTSSLGNVIYDFATTSLTMYPLQYRVFELADTSIAYHAETVDSIDTDALTAAQDGYTDRQIERMNEGLNAYAKDFLKAGVQYRLELSLTMEKMGIKESDFYYDLVNTAVGELVRDLRLPLYGENSLSEKAAEYGMEFPETAYKNGWDLATELVAAHYAGGEDFDLNSDEVTILLRAVALILKDDLANVNDEVILKAANSLLSKFGTSSVTADFSKLTASVFGAVSPCGYFAVALVSPLLYNFAVDCDGVNDNFGNLPGYDTVDFISKTEALKIKYKNTFEKIFDYLNMFFSYIIKMFIR